MRCRRELILIFVCQVQLFLAFFFAITDNHERIIEAIHKMCVPCTSSGNPELDLLCGKHQTNQSQDFWSSHDLRDDDEVVSKLRQLFVVKDQSDMAPTLLSCLEVPGDGVCDRCMNMFSR